MKFIKSSAWKRTRQLKKSAPSLVYYISSIYIRRIIIKLLSLFLRPSRGINRTHAIPRYHNPRLCSALLNRRRSSSVCVRFASLAGRFSLSLSLRRSRTHRVVHTFHHWRECPNKDSRPSIRRSRLASSSSETPFDFDISLGVRSLWQITRAIICSISCFLFYLLVFISLVGIFI